jgi:hypothetical protein
VLQHVFLKERPHDAHERDTLLWCIPLVYITPDSLNASVPRGQVVWMKEQRYININNLPGPDSFVIVNPNEIGELSAYSRLQYTVTSWQLELLVMPLLSVKLTFLTDDFMFFIHRSGRCQESR